VEITPKPDPADVSVHDAVGGLPFFERLVDAFYERVAADPVLLPLYPDPDDLGPARRRLTLFLVQYWGGPTTYSDERGHPRLRQRHFPYPIGTDERDRWLSAMTGALDQVRPAAELRERFDQYFAMAAHAMINQER
jgi:hemoglobin